jgi:hypothetical protein
MKRTCFLVLFVSNAAVAQQQTPSVQQEVWALTEVMYHDVVNPPAAARFYAYSILTGYEILSRLENDMLLFQRNFRNYPVINLAFDANKINKELAVLYGILETGKNSIPSGYLLEEKQEDLLHAFSNLSKDEIDSSVSFAKQVAKKIIQFSTTDGYFQLSGMNRYQPRQGEEYWQPTPPEYMAAVEPNWKNIRTFFLDSAAQCSPVTMEAFSKEKTSSFYQLANEVYSASVSLTPEQRLIANFWDCNPFAVQFQGHMSVGLKKISPGGHWMGITGIACKKARLDLKKTLLVHTIVALTLHDSFICCWNAKYATNRVRPETVINKYIDEKWQPLLQTPPFPEYPSGHSVISTSTAEVLTQFFGDHFSFNDSVETYLGLPSRNFASFNAAAAEARISRLYGGIHFRDAIENGGTSGEEIGKLIIHKTEIKNIID